MLTQSERNYLIDSMENLLGEYGYDYKIDSLNHIIDTWESEKGVLIEAFKKHPNYIEGKFMIAFDTDYERRIDRNASHTFGTWIVWTAMSERRHTCPKAVEGSYHYGFSYDVYCFFEYLRNYAERCISENTAAYLNGLFTELHFHAGQKTSRVVNKICCYLGLDKVDGYNREFAKYADSLSPMTIKRHTILSLNPLDYLTMSFGNSWASCHTIDKENRRNMPNNYSGCYSSGTISYMLDPSSMVLYTVDASYNGTEYWKQPKINRQMFHYGEEKLVQARLYPQDCDGDDGAYTPYRNIVQEIISTIFGFPNLWTLKRGTGEANYYIRSYGTHYRDYQHYSNCTISRIKGSENENTFAVGSNPICVNCGHTHSVETNIDCCHTRRCADCGRVIDDEDDEYWVDDECYCRDCVEYCEYCEEYTHNETTYVRNYGYVCDHCLENFTYCECCGAYVRDDDSVYIDSEDRYVCDDCRDMYYTYCEDCGEYFANDDMHCYGDLMLCEDCYDARVDAENEDDNEDEEVC